MIDSRSLWRKYLLALILVGVVSTASLGAVYVAGGIARHHVAAVNIAGRQRMLSQRIALLAHQYSGIEKSAERAAVRAELARTIDQFHTAHLDLVNGNTERNLSSPLSPEVRQHFLGAPANLDRNVEEFVALARRVIADSGASDADLIREIVARAGPLVTRLDEAVTLIDRDARDAAAWGDFIELIAWLSTIALLALVAAVVVRPAHHEIVRRFQTAERKARIAAEENRRFKDDNRRLWEAVNLMRDGFAIYDRNDRLILANKAFIDFHEPIADLIVPGVSFEEILRAGLERNMWNLQGEDPEKWIEQQIAPRHEADEFKTEVTLADGRCMVRHERRLATGEIIGTRIDVTEDRAREDELRSTEQQLERLAFFDELTGLPNRFHCQKDLAEQFVFAEPDDMFAVIHLDLDNFKRVNDTLGHAAGDRLLTDIGSRLTLLCSELGFLKAYRWGGDEFIVTVTRKGNDVDLEEICQELTDDLAVPVTFNGTIVRPTVSIGIARYPEDGEDVDSLMKFADLALYATKERGRDGYQFFTGAMKDKADNESWIETELRVAIDRGLFSLVYQPQVGVMDGAVNGIEALIRWNHPEKGVISPGEFLPIAEATDLARPIGRAVFDMAMGAARSWLDRGLDFGRVAINLSPQHLKTGMIYDDFLRAMTDHQIKPQYLTAEILESLLLDDPHSNKVDIIRRLHDLGINIELDDFGTGYASLAHLSSLPIDGLKVDRSFINQILVDEKKYSVVKTLINLAKMLRIGIVCEGIENGEQLAALRRLGDFSIQGYHIARPMSFDDMTGWLEANGAAKTAPERATA